MDAALRNLVRARAENRCEYCGIAQSADPLFRFHIEHVVPRQHGGMDDTDNLALACGHCNRHKGPNLTAIDPDSDAVVTLYHLRQKQWEEHFELAAGVVTGMTPVGRATVRLLRMNDGSRTDLRSEITG
jgi:hypothetical protein